MFEEGTRLQNFRFPVGLIEELEEAKHWLRKPSVSELVREAIREYLERRAPEIEAHRRTDKRVRKPAGNK